MVSLINKRVGKTDLVALTSGRYVITGTFTLWQLPVSVCTCQAHCLFFSFFYKCTTDLDQAPPGHYMLGTGPIPWSSMYIDDTRHSTCTVITIDILTSGTENRGKGNSAKGKEEHKPVTTVALDRVCVRVWRRHVWPCMCACICQENVYVKERNAHILWCTKDDNNFNLFCNYFVSLSPHITLILATGTFLSAGRKSSQTTALYSSVCEYFVQIASPRVCVEFAAFQCRLATRLAPKWEQPYSRATVVGSLEITVCDHPCRWSETARKAPSLSVWLFSCQ